MSYDVTEARAKWAKAETAYSDELRLYIAIGTPPVEFPSRTFTPEAEAELKRLRKAADDAEEAFIRAVRDAPPTG